MRFVGKTILITGGSSGIGKAIAIYISKKGAKVILIGRDCEKLKEAYSNLEGNGHSYFSLDLKEINKIEPVIMQAVDISGKIDGFVHCAGIEVTLPLKNSKRNIWEDVFSVNVYAGFEIARLVSQKKYRNAKASFVFMSSVMGKLGEGGKVIYCSSKGAVLGGVKAIAVEFAQKGIRCNAVLPGIVETELVEKLFNGLSKDAKDKIISKHPLGIGKPEDVASLTAFLLSDDAGWITGSEFVIDGGYSAS